MAFRVTVESEKCKNCEECLDVCTVNVFTMKDGKSVVVREQECPGCKSCVDVIKSEPLRLRNYSLKCPR